VPLISGATLPCTHTSVLSIPTHAAPAHAGKSVVSAISGVVNTVNVGVRAASAVLMCKTPISVRSAM
jgi:hypothetical protein